MKSRHNTILFSLFATLLISWTIYKNNWIIEKHKGYTLQFKQEDKSNIKKYNSLFKNGIKSVHKFFNTSFKKDFVIVIHPKRASLDSTWQNDWKMPEFKSECWMVASGVANKLDIISPKQWKKEACEHDYSETKKTQQLVTHELFHVFHGQQNTSPDFSNTEGIDWFVEGLATYASGQCDATRIVDVTKAINEHKIPKSLDNFWTGKIKYGLSGSVVLYIDHKYGREKLKRLLPFNKKSEILSFLNITESELLSEWEKFMLSYKVQE